LAGIVAQPVVQTVGLARVRLLGLDWIIVARVRVLTLYRAGLVGLG
jgi:hypothetical protein